MPLKKRVLLVDDHPIYRMGLALLLQKQKQFEVFIERSTPESAWQTFQCEPFDLVICDIWVHSKTSFELVKNIRHQPSACPILVLSIQEEEFWARRALKVGANGYLMKNDPIADVLRAVDTVMAGDIYLNQRVQQQILRDISGQTAEAIPLNLLTEREVEVFQHLIHGMDSDSIGKALFISLKTVQTHQANIRRKLDVASLTELRQLAYRYRNSGIPQVN